eukprot:COSAG01_NODE_25779_length_733_cov_1.151420_1_plen_27_part_10
MACSLLAQRGPAYDRSIAAGAAARQAA